MIAAIFGTSIIEHFYEHNHYNLQKNKNKKLKQEHHVPNTQF